VSSDLSHVYALDSYTIKESGGRFFIAKTGTNRYGRPYASLRLACLGITRRMEAEYVERKNRRIAYNKKFAVKRRVA
jgi:hypothetical protein